jgi:hypothetical protein
MQENATTPVSSAPSLSSNTDSNTDSSTSANNGGVGRLSRGMIVLISRVATVAALGSCIYNILFGHIPFHDLDASTRVRKLIMNEFPATMADTLFGDLTLGCWHGVYDFIGAVEQDILWQLQRAPDEQKYCRNESQGEIDHMQSLLLAECEDFFG